MRKKGTILATLFLLLIVGWGISQLVRLSPFLLQLLFDRNIALRKTDGNINLLAMGISGGTNEGPELTDTIIFVSLNPEKNVVTLLSIPRDLWIPQVKERVNTLYAIGGLTLSKREIATVLHQPIEYAVVVDFEGFVKAIDLMGGLDIAVERTFDDYEYPIEDKREDLCGRNIDEATQLLATQEATLVFPCRYQYVHFEKGKTHMDGKQALIFVRSRNAKGPEGSDFARSVRQQKVIKAFRDKLFSTRILFNPIAITSLYTVLSKSIVTDIKHSEFDDFIRLAEKMKNAELRSFTIDSQDSASKKKGLLTNPPITDFDGKWVLIPRTGEGNYKEIHEYVSCLLSLAVCEIK